MLISIDYQVRCFGEKTMAALYELDRIQLGLSEERLIIKLCGSREVVCWQMTESGELQPWDESTVLLPVVIPVTRIPYPEVLEPVSFVDEEVATILEVCAPNQSLAIRGHWQDGQLYEAVVRLERPYPCSLLHLASCNRKELKIDYQ